MAATTTAGRAQRKVGLFFAALLVLVAVLLFALAAMRPAGDVLAALYTAVGGVFLGIAVPPALSLPRLLRDVIDKDRQDQREAHEVSELARSTTDLGFKLVSEDWESLAGSSGVGAQIRDRLASDRGPSTWYFLTLNPVGFFSKDWFSAAIIPAMRRGVKIRWAYIPIDGACDESLRNFLDTQDPHPSEDRRKRLDSAIESLEASVTNLKNSADNTISKLTADRVSLEPSSFQICASRIPHPFLAFVSVESDDNPLRGYALVHPYQMYGGEKRWGMYLEGPGEIFQQYAASVINHFKLGVARGYMQQVWPTVDTVAAAQKPPD